MRGALAIRLLIPLCAALLLLVTLLALTLDALATQSERDLREGRYAYILAQLKQRVEVPLSLGLQVESLDYLQHLLEQEAAAEADILSIDLFNARGEQLFTTDAAGIRQSVPDSWLQEIQALPAPQDEAPAAASYWLGEERDGRVLGVALYNDFGLLVGGLALRHRASDVGEALLGPGTLLLLAVAGGAALLGGLGFWWLSKPIDREAESLAAALRGRAEGPQGSSTESTALGEDGLRLLKALQKAEQECDTAAAEVERIDGRG